MAGRGGCSEIAKKDVKTVDEEERGKGGQKGGREGGGGD